jgi:hemerythrin
MDSHSPDIAAYEAVLEGHRTLRGLIGQIDEALAKKTATIAEVSDLLARLGDQLIKHFALEEEGGYFAEALTHAPQLVARANALLAQHPKMHDQARSLIVDLMPDQGRDQWWQETGARFQAFKAELLKHERHEDTLLQEAYTQDLGSHD